MTDGYKRFILEMMKRYIYILLAAISAFVLYGCSKEEAPLPVDKGLAGEWVLSSWNGTAPGEDFSVYMAIREDGTFDIFEKVVTPVYVRYSGTFTADGTTFSGTRWRTFASTRGPTYRTMSFRHPKQAARSPERIPRDSCRPRTCDSEDGSDFPVIYRHSPVEFYDFTGVILIFVG